MAVGIMTNSIVESLNLLHQLEAISEENGIKMFKDGWLPPALTDPNYVPPDKGNTLLISNGLFMAVTLLVVITRFYTRSFIAGRLGWDDYSIGAATLILLGSTALNVYGVKEGGFGRHFYDLDVDKVGHMLKAVYALPIVYSVGVFSVKLSILLFERRLFGTNKKMQRIVLSLILFQAAFAFASVLTFAFICNPANGWWDLSKHGTACPSFRKTNTIYFSLRVVTVVCDVIVLVLPIPMVVRLNIPRRQRLGLSVLFGLGILACGAAIARLALLPRLLLSLDVPWNVLPIALLDQVEQSLGIITASIPALTAIISRTKKGRIQRAYRPTSSIELKRGKAATPGPQDFDFLSFAYDPDRIQQVYTAYAYGGSSRRNGDGPDNDQFSTTSDENLVDLDPNRINKSTTVTVTIN